MIAHSKIEKEIDDLTAHVASWWHGNDTAQLMDSGVFRLGVRKEPGGYRASWLPDQGSSLEHRKHHSQLYKTMDRAKRAAIRAAVIHGCFVIYAPEVHGLEESISRGFWGAGSG